MNNKKKSREKHFTEWLGGREPNRETVAQYLELCVTEEMQPNFLGANLSSLSLSGFNFTGAILTGVILINAILIGANLKDANLFKANLQGANLSYTILRRANLQDANLFNANLFRANLQDANLSLANLRRAILQDANITNADLTDADLTDTDYSDAIFAGTKGIVVRDASKYSTREDAILAVVADKTDPTAPTVYTGCFVGTVEKFKAHVSLRENATQEMNEDYIALLDDMLKELSQQNG